MLVRARSETLLDELALVGRADHGCVSLHADKSAELLKEAVGETVIRRDLDLASIGREVGEFGAEAIAEFTGSLVRERDAERGLGFDSLRDQRLEPKHDCGCLAGTGPRRDPEGDERSGHDGGLFRGESEAHETKASSPSGTAGHATRTGHRTHAGPGVGDQSSLGNPAGDGCHTVLDPFEVRDVERSCRDRSLEGVHREPHLCFREPNRATPPRGPLGLRSRRSRAGATLQHLRCWPPPRSCSRRSRHRPSRSSMRSARPNQRAASRSIESSTSDPIGVPMLGHNV